MTERGVESTLFFVNLPNSHNLLVVRHLRRLELRKSLILKDLQNKWGTKKRTHEHEYEIILFNTIVFVIYYFIIWTDCIVFYYL